MKNKKLLIVVVSILLIAIITAGGTVAYFAWTSTGENKDATLTINSVSGDGVCQKLTDNNLALKPVSARESGRVVTINAKQRVSKYAFVRWNLTINSINNAGTTTNGLKDKTVRYELVNTTTGTLYANGNLEGVSAGDTIVLENITETLAYNTDYTFTFYLWIDGGFGDTPLDTANQAYDFDLTCQMVGTPNSVSDYLMVQPYTVNTDGVTSTSIRYMGSTTRTTNNVLGKTIDPNLFESITTVASNTVPNGISPGNYWDVSNNQNGSVMAWYTDSDSDGLYELYIGQNGGVIANPDSSHLFSEFRKVTSIDLSHLNTSNVTNMDSMFKNCRVLTSLDFSNFDTSKVTDMRLMFYACMAINSFNLTNFDTSNVIYMCHMFRACTSLTTLDVSTFNTSSVTDMAGMFLQCFNVTSINVNNFNTSNVTNMLAMFQHCHELLTLDLSDFDTSSVTDMAGMFSNCQKITSINLDGFDVSNVQSLDTLFYGCAALRSIDLSSFDTSNVTNMNVMFENCSSLTTIYVSNLWSNENVNTNDSIFNLCTSLIGQNGTSYNVNNIRSSYAVIDTPSTPGYLTYKEYNG